MEIRKIEIGKLSSNSGQLSSRGLPRNPRTIEEGRFKRLCLSLREHPEMLSLREIIAYDNQGELIVVCGNMRLSAAKEIGLTELPTKVLPYETSIEDLQAYTIIDNNEYGEYDWEALMTDWDVTLLSDWGVDIPMLDFPKEEEQIKEEEQPTATEDNYDETSEIPQRASKGDLWQLGRHRLMCGDSTDPESVARLMGGEKADLCFTSPPYNVGGFKLGDSVNQMYLKKEGGAYNEYSDNLSDSDYADFLSKALQCALNNADDVIFNIGCTKGAIRGTAEFLGANAQYFAGIIAWVKTSAFSPMFDSQRGILRNLFEPMYFFNDRGTRAFKHAQWEKTDMEDNVFSCKNAGGNEYAKEHKATFPVELPFHYIQRCTKTSVLDIFGGSGTTMVAAEQLGRQAFLMELDPHYCDIIIDRFEKLTGEKASVIEQ